MNDLLGVLVPRLEGADLASLELAVASAGLELRFAERERQRLEGLRGEGAVPDRRVQGAVHATEEAQASLAAAQRRLFRRVERTAGRGEGTVQLRAPLSGTVTEMHVAPGAFVEAGAPLFRVTDLTQLWLEARVPEADVGRLGTPFGASFRVEGRDDAIDLPAEAIVARGHVLDPQSQTLPIMFAVDNAGGHLPVGAFCRVFLATGEERRASSSPTSRFCGCASTDPDAAALACGSSNSPTAGGVTSRGSPGAAGQYKPYPRRRDGYARRRPEQTVLYHRNGKQSGFGERGSKRGRVDSSHRPRTLRQVPGGECRDVRGVGQQNGRVSSDADSGAHGPQHKRA